MLEINYTGVVLNTATIIVVIIIGKLTPPPALLLPSSGPSKLSTEPEPNPASPPSPAEPCNINICLESKNTTYHEIPRTVAT